MDQELFGIVDDRNASNHTSHSTTHPNQNNLPFHGDGNGGDDGSDGDGGANGDGGGDDEPSVRSALVFPTAQLLVMISNEGDADLGTRAFRLLSGT